LARDAFSIIAGEQHMPNRTAKFVSATIVSFIAGAPFATMSQGATPAPATDNCLASPQKDAPQGGHWHYRIEHPSNRHCWYLRGEQAASSNVSTAQPNVSTPASAKSPNAASAMPGSVANARAELVSPQMRGDPDASIVTGQVPAAAAGPVAGADNPAAAKVQDANMLRSVVASRWPDQLAADTPADSAPVADNSDASASSDADVTPQPPAAAVVPLTAAEAPPARQSSSTQMLIIAIVGALSVAGLAASAVGYGGRRKHGLGEIQIEVENSGDRRAIWETTLADRPRPSPFAASAAIRPNIGIPRELREVQDSDDKIAEMLVRLARSAQA
jgi:hypothetical protein